jgi:hypothetical protein
MHDARYYLERFKMVHCAWMDSAVDGGVIDSNLVKQLLEDCPTVLEVSDVVYEMCEDDGLSHEESDVRAKEAGRLFGIERDSWWAATRVGRS